MKIPQQYQVPYGKSSIRFDLPSSMQGTVATSQPVEPVEDAQSAIKTALETPLGTPQLRELANQGQRVCIVYTDITRSSPDHILVPALLDELEIAGVRDEDITLLCGIGMHRVSSIEEKIIKLGRAIVNRYRVIDNEPQNNSALVDLGTTAGGIPVLLHRETVEADLLITTGIVEPHQYAGYSGGSKTLAIGAAGEALISETHGPGFVDHPGTRLGRIDGNPFQEVITEVARMAGLRFILNVVLDSEKCILRVAAGDPDQVFKDLVTFARSVYEIPISNQYDIAVGGVGYPKDSNLYQASRAPTNLFFAPTPVVRPGGFFIIPARCEEGAGAGVGEQRFLKAMRDAPDIYNILDDARRSGYPPGQQRAFVLAKVLEQTQIVVVGSDHPDLVSDCKMLPAPTMDAALSIAEQSLGEACQVLIVPNAMLTLPIVQPKPTHM
jgi:nickel-dependent lactate racemase